MFFFKQKEIFVIIIKIIKQIITEIKKNLKLTISELKQGTIITYFLFIFWALLNLLFLLHIPELLSSSPFSCLNNFFIKFLLRKKTHRLKHNYCFSILFSAFFLEQFPYPPFHIPVLPHSLLLPHQFHLDRK